MGKESRTRSERKSVRIVVKQQLESVLNTELVSAIRKELGAKVDEGLARLNKVLTDKLNDIDTRSRDIQSAFVKGTLAKPLGASDGVIPLPTAEIATEATPVQE